MASPSTEINTLRDRVTRLLDDLDRQLPSALAIVEGAGEDDAGRAAFFREYLGSDQDPVTDVAFSEVAQATAKLRELNTWLETNRPTLAKLRR